MPTQLNPYLNFQANARTAMAFYKEVFGGEVTVATFGETQQSGDPIEDQKVMHAELRAPNGVIFMAADTPNHLEYQPGTNFSMSLSGDNEEELRGYFDRLGVGGTVAMPLERAPWGDTFGMLTDQFGVQWLVNISAGS